MRKVFARKNMEDRYQMLQEHLQGAMAIAEDNSQYPATARLVAMMHDIGKACTSFQNYLMQGGERGSVVHSNQGAMLVEEICRDKQNDQCMMLLKDIAELVISCHHGELADCVKTDGTFEFDKLNEKYHYAEVKKTMGGDYYQEVSRAIDIAHKEMSSTVQTIATTFKSRSLGYAIGLLTKYIYSSLIDADRYDAYLFDIQKPYIPKVERQMQQSAEGAWTELIRVFEDSMVRFANRKDKMSQIRNNISNKCRDAAEKEAGIYQLSVPTGGGKTLSSLRFALHHAEKYCKKRIIYVIPYLSIIEQTANTIRDVLQLEKDSEIMLEHHSNIVADEHENSGHRKLASQRWDSPIIVTTIVQFLESVMSSKASRLRKFHNMADSVIIFDEIQSLPLRSINLFNETVSFLSQVLGATILLCSATQPLLSNTQRQNLLMNKDCQLIEETEQDFAALKRTQVVQVPERSMLEFAEFVYDRAKEEGNCLAIVNTKKTAKTVYAKLAELNSDKFEIIHLSTSMCARHREVALEKVKERLVAGVPVICIATQLIEAGVDISFSCVVRAMAGLDSIAQAAGRCNRSGELMQTKLVYAINITDENIGTLKEIEEGKAVALRIFRECPDVNCLEQGVLDKYYKYYYTNSNQQKMDYITSAGCTVYEMLAGDIHKSKGTHFLTQMFATASQEYCVIDNNSKAVVVMYKESIDLLEQYRKAYAIGDKLDIIKKLQKYSVSLYIGPNSEYQKLCDMHKIYQLDEEFDIKVLVQDSYSMEYGVELENNSNNEIV